MLDVIDTKIHELEAALVLVPGSKLLEDQIAEYQEMARCIVSEGKNDS